MDFDQDLDAAVSTTTDTSRPEDAALLADRIFAMPFDEQIALLRTLVPQVLGCLSESERAPLLESLADEAERAYQGELTFDVRAVKPAVH